LIAELERENPDIRRSMLAALGNVRPTQLLDQRLLAALGTREANEAEDLGRLVTLGERRSAAVS
jgi:hypothetical protein